MSKEQTKPQSQEVYITVVRPPWAQGNSIDEQGFCQEFLVRYPMLWQDGNFYSRRGRLTEEEVRTQVYEYLCPYYRSGLVTKTAQLMEVLKLECRKKVLQTPERAIVCANGVYDLFEGWKGQTREFYRFRLPVDYDPEAPEPKRWLAFLEELLEPEDILTLQEYMGYCLIPVNYAQKMLLIVGSGGEGKSRISIVLEALLGKAMKNGSLAKLETSPFARADLEPCLLMVDDDLRLEALNNTNYIKSIITAEQAMDLERKGVQSYQARLYCRLMAFGNGSLRSLHDRSFGFFRRQIILTTKERRPDRVDDPYLSHALKKELGGILLWCIRGLERLLIQEMQFTLSQKARENLRMAVAEGNNVVEFMESEGYFRLDPAGQVSSRTLYNLYRDWCEDNMIAPLTAKTVTAWLMQNASRYGLTYSYHIPGGNGRHVRGFQGIRPVSKI